MKKPSAPTKATEGVHVLDITIFRQIAFSDNYIKKVSPQTQYLAKGWT